MFCLILADNGTKIHSNYALFDTDGKGTFQNGDWTGKKHPNVNIITPYDLVGMLEGERCNENQIITLQEVYAWFNSHKSMSDISDFEDTFVFQSGKLGYDWIVDAQLVTRVSGALRKLANIRIEAENDIENHCFNYYLLDIHFPDKDIRTGESFSISHEFAANFWNRYDTYVRTPPLGLAELKCKMETLEPHYMNQTIERQTQLIYSKKDTFGILTSRDVNVTAVKDALIQLNEPLAHASYVTNRLKLKMDN